MVHAMRQVGLVVVIALVGVALTILAGCWSAGIGPFAAPTRGNPEPSRGGPPLSLGVIDEATSGSGSTALYYYNSTLEGTLGGLNWSDLEFQVQTASGTQVPGPVEVLATRAAPACAIAQYSFFTTHWSAPTSGSCPTGDLGGDAATEAGQGVHLTSVANLTAQGYVLVMIGQGAFSGEATFTIP